MSWKSMMMAAAVASANPQLTQEHPDVTEITPVDAKAIRKLIRQQMDAFRSDDGGTAFALSSDAIRRTFRSPTRLLTLIKEKYPALVTSEQVGFGEFVITPDGIGILLDLMNEQQQAEQALYLVVRGWDGSWRVNGCMMLPNRQVAEKAA